MRINRLICLEFIVLLFFSGISYSTENDANQVFDSGDQLEGCWQVKKVSPHRNISGANTNREDLLRQPEDSLNGKVNLETVFYRCGKLCFNNANEFQAFSKGSNDVVFEASCMLKNDVIIVSENENTYNWKVLSRSKNELVLETNKEEVYLVRSGFSDTQSRNEFVGKWKVSKKTCLVFGADGKAEFILVGETNEPDTIRYAYEVIDDSKNNLVLDLIPAVESDVIENLTLTLSQIKRNKMHLTVEAKSKVMGYRGWPASSTLKRIRE
mgnify:CR=1 FL=1